MNRNNTISGGFRDSIEGIFPLVATAYDRLFARTPQLMPIISGVIWRNISSKDLADALPDAKGVPALMLFNPQTQSFEIWLNCAQLEKDFPLVHIEGVLLHEILHTLKRHPSRYRLHPTIAQAILCHKESRSLTTQTRLKVLRQMWNIAADCAVNSVIPNRILPVCATTAVYLNMPSMRSAEFYFETLMTRDRQDQSFSTKRTEKAMKSQEDKSCSCASYKSGKENPCVHDATETPSTSPMNSKDVQDKEAEQTALSELKRLVKEKCIRIIRDTIERNFQRTMSVRMAKKISDDKFSDALISQLSQSEGHSYASGDVGATLLRDTGENFSGLVKQHFKNVLRSGSTVDVKFSRTREDRRYGTTPGVRLHPKKKIVFIVDVSSSIDMNRLQSSIPLLNDFSKESEIWVITHNTFPSVPFRWKRRDSWYPRLGGGTMFAATFRRALALRADAVIWYTDGGFSDNEITQSIATPNCPFLWLLMDCRGLTGLIAEYLPTWGKKVIIQEANTITGD